MIEVKVEGKEKLSVARQKDATFINDQLFEGEIIKVNKITYKVYRNNKIFNVELVEQNRKEITLKINGILLQTSVTDHIDQILDKLGMNVAASASLKEVKAPMPGSILNVLISEGAEVKAGDQLLVLEAMKMENVIKSPGEGKVSKIHISEKENVEKNQTLISFE